MTDLENKTIKEILIARFGEKLGNDMIITLQEGIDNKESDDELMARLVRTIEPSLTDPQIKNIMRIFRPRPVSSVGRPPPPE